MEDDEETKIFSRNFICFIQRDYTKVAEVHFSF